MTSPRPVDPRSDPPRPDPRPGAGTEVDAALLRRLPKVELHRHLEGTVRTGTVHELADRNGVRLPAADMSRLYRFRDLPEFLAVLDAVCTALVTADDFYRVAYEATEDAAAAGVVYTETFLSPHHHLRRGVAFETMWNGVTTGLRDAERDTGVATRVILNVDKRAGAGPALELVELAKDTTGYLVGIGGDGVEAGVDNTALAPAFERAAARGLRRTLHAGEFTTESVAEAVDALGCERVDHGPLVVADAELTARLVDRGVGLTLCPTSDVVISQVFPDLSRHTLPDLLRAGLRVTLNSDDPALVGADVADEYAAVVRAGLVEPAALRGIALNGVDACWLPEPERARLRSRVAAAWDDAALAGERGRDATAPGAGSGGNARDRLRP